MKKVAVVYWSGTGNTEAMAAAVAEGAKEKGAEAELITAGLLPCLVLFSLRRIAPAAVIAFSSSTRSPLALVLSFFASSGCRLNAS